MTTEPITEIMHRYANKPYPIGSPHHPTMDAIRIANRASELKWHEALVEAERLLSLCTFDLPEDLAGVELVRNAIARNP